MFSFELRSTGKVRIASAVAAGLFICCTSPCVEGQAADKIAAGDQAPALLKLESNLVVVRVIVRDGKGNPVNGLKREDFKRYDQGREQSITKFEEEPSDELGSGPAIVLSEQTATRRSARPGRSLALYFDDLDTSAGDMMRARDAALRFLGAGTEPRDRVTIFTTEKMLSDFTSDPKQIDGTLSELRPSSRALAGAQSECPNMSDFQAQQITQSMDPSSDAWKVAFEELSICRGIDNPLVPQQFSGQLSSDSAAAVSQEMAQIQVQARRIVDQAQLQVRSNLQQFERVVRYVSLRPGQRTVILVSPGFLAEKPSGYSVQARRGYFALATQPATANQAGDNGNETPKTEEPIPPPASDPQAQERNRLREAIRSRIEIAELPVELDMKVSAGQGETRELSVLTHVGGTNLHFHKDGDHNLNTLTFVLGVFDLKDNPVQFLQRHADLSVPDGQLSEFLKTGLTVTIIVQLKPGDYRVREVVSDSEQHHTTAMNREVIVP
jgi:VWFA-related protein